MKNNIGIIAQLILAIAIITFSILYFLEPAVLIVLQVLTALFMFVLAYNNRITYKRNIWYTLVYILTGLVIIGAIVL